MTDLDGRTPLPEILAVAAPMTDARNILKSWTEYGGLTNSLALGQLAYAIRNIPSASEALIADGGEFTTMEVDAPAGLLMKAHNLLAQNAVVMNGCIYLEVAGVIAEAHKLLRRFHKRLGYMEITDEMLATVPRQGAGGGGR